MPVQHVIELLNIIDSEPELREQMYNCVHPDDVFKYLYSKGYHFNTTEFEEAVRILHVKCQTYEEADLLLHKAEWLRFQLTLEKLPM